MIAVDTNVLIAAHRAEHPHHQLATARLTEVAEGQSPWGVPVFCIGEFLRVVTHARVFGPPTSLEVASSFIDHLRESPSLRILTPGVSYWTFLRNGAAAAAVTGNLIFDAMIAAVCEERGATKLITGDRDFARFEALDPEFLW